jgi:hypothetical protein
MVSVRTGRQAHLDAKARSSKDRKGDAVLCPWVSVQRHGDECDDVADEYCQHPLPPGHPCSSTTQPGGFEVTLCDVDHQLQPTSSGPRIRK